MNRGLGKSKGHLNLKRIKKNIRRNNEEGRSGVESLTEKICVLVGFTRANVGHFCVVRTRRSKQRVVIEKEHTFPFHENTWMDTSQLVRVHEIGIA